MLFGSKGAVFGCENVFPVMSPKCAPTRRRCWGDFFGVVLPPQAKTIKHKRQVDIDGLLIGVMAFSDHTRPSTLSS